MPPVGPGIGTNPPPANPYRDLAQRQAKTIKELREQLAAKAATPAASGAGNGKGNGNGNVLPTPGGAPGGSGGNPSPRTLFLRSLSQLGTAAGALVGSQVCLVFFPNVYERSACLAVVNALGGFFGLEVAGNTARESIPGAFSGTIAGAGSGLVTPYVIKFISFVRRKI
jgi:hypothetical protein